MLIRPDVLPDDLLGEAGAAWEEKKDLLWQEFRASGL